MHEDPPKLIQPRDHKAKVTIWGDLSVTDMDRIDEVATADQVKAELADIFHLENYQDDLKAGILLDLYYYTIQFSRDNKFTKEQTSTFFSIIKRTHEVCIETPFGNVEQAFNYFREMVLCHAVKRPPFSIDLFTAEEVRKITEYTINTYFRHYKMYKYVFTPLVRLDLTMTYTGMPPSPPPSESGEAAGDGEEKGDAEKLTEEGELGETAADGSVLDATATAPDDNKNSVDTSTNLKAGHKGTASKSNLKVGSTGTPRGASSIEHKAPAAKNASHSGKDGSGANQSKSKGKGRTAKTGSATDPADTLSTKEGQSDQESAAAQELKSLIRSHLAEELSKLKLSVDEQLKQQEDELNKKLQAVESSTNKSGKGSAKGKRK